MRFEDIYEAAKELDETIGVLDTVNLFALYRLDDNLKKSLEDYDYSSIEDSLLGVITYKPNNPYKIGSVYAKKGYGPILYELVLTKAGQEGLTPNPVNVSRSAKRVWQEFYRREDVEKTANNDNPETALDYTYILKKPKSYGKYSSALKEFVKPDMYKEKIDMLLEVADTKLSDEMERIYN